MKARAAALVLALAASAHAQPARDPAGAEALFRSAKDAVKRGDYAAACPLFAESARLDRAPGTLINLADCEEHIGQPANAWAHFTEAEQKFAPTDSRVAYAHGRAEAALKRTAKLTVRLGPGVPERTQVLRDAVGLGPASLGRAFPVDPGDHVLVTRAPDGREQRITRRLAEGEQAEIVLDLPAAPAAPPVVSPPPPASPPPAPPPPPEKPPSETRTIGFVVGGIGLGLLAVGGVAGLVTSGYASTFKSHCDASGCDPQGLDAASSGKTWSTVSTVTVIAGAVGLAAGAYLVFRPAPRTTVSATPRAVFVTRAF